MTSGRCRDGLVIGIDFDNTIAAYDDVFHATAARRGLIALDTEPSKSQIRDAIRQRKGGELDWQRLQAEVYGPLMPKARILDGVLPFLQLCRERQIPVCVISHKTEFARRDETQTNLRWAALHWMRSQGLLDDITGLSTDRVFFENTRQEKILRIRQQACTHFVDDLVEVLLEAGFPGTVDRILLSSKEIEPPEGIRAVPDWPAVSRMIFDA